MAFAFLSPDLGSRDLKKRLKVLSTFRLVIASLFCFFTLTFQPGVEGQAVSTDFWVMLLVTGINLVAAVGFFLSSRLPFWFGFIRYGYFQTVWDVMFATGLVYLTGGVESDFKIMFVLSIFNAGLLLFQAGAFFAACLSGAFYGVLVNVMYSGKIPMFFSQTWDPLRWESDQVMRSVFLNCLVFFAFAWFSAFLAATFRKSEHALHEKNKEVKDLKEVMEALTEMTARMAHEIRNPLTSISGAVQMLQAESELAQNKKLMEIVVKETNRLNGLITDFLNFSKPRAFQPKDVLITKLVSDTIELFSKNREKKLNIRLDLQPNVKVRADETKMSQVLWNLVENASEAMDHKGDIEIKLKKENETIVLDIQDHGRGIPKNMLGKIFLPFFTTKVRGTGLGLATVSQVIHEHGGHVWVNSEEGQGTLFRLTLPEQGQTSKNTLAQNQEQEDAYGEITRH